MTKDTGVQSEVNALIDEYAVSTVMSRAELTAVAREYEDADMVRFMFKAKARQPYFSWPWLAYVYRLNAALPTAEPTPELAATVDAINAYLRK